MFLYLRWTLWFATWTQCWLYCRPVWSNKSSTLYEFIVSFFSKQCIKYNLRYKCKVSRRGLLFVVPSCSCGWLPSTLTRKLEVDNLTSNLFILHLVRKGLRVTLKQNTILYSEPLWQWLSHPQKLPNSVFQEMLDKNVLRECTEPKHYRLLFSTFPSIETERNGQTNIQSQRLNKSILDYPFKMHTVQSVREAVPSKAYCVSLDIKRYLSFPVHITTCSLFRSLLGEPSISVSSHAFWPQNSTQSIHCTSQCHSEVGAMPGHSGISLPRRLVDLSPKPSGPSNTSKSANRSVNQPRFDYKYREILSELVYSFGNGNDKKLVHMKCHP